MTSTMNHFFGRKLMWILSKVHLGESNIRCSKMLIRLYSLNDESKYVLCGGNKFLFHRMHHKFSFSKCYDTDDVCPLGIGRFYSIILCIDSLNAPDIKFTKLSSNAEVNLYNCEFFYFI